MKKRQSVRQSAASTPSDAQRTKRSYQSESDEEQQDASIDQDEDQDQNEAGVATGQPNSGEIRPTKAIPTPFFHENATRNPTQLQSARDPGAV